MVLFFQIIILSVSRCLISQENKYYFCGSYLTPCCLILLINFILFCLLVKVSRKPRYQIKGFIIGISQVIVLKCSFV